MNRKHYLLTVALACLGAFTSCIDDSYDLDNIDTIGRITVDNLTIPVNLDKISLNSIIDINEEGDVRIVETTDGKECYAIYESGNIHSDQIYIRPVFIKAPKVEPTVITLTKESLTRAGDFTFNIASPATSYHFVSDPVVADIVSLDRIGGDITLTITFTLPELGNILNSFELTDLEIQLPKGFTIDSGDYNPQTGAYRVRETINGQNNKVSLPIHATGLSSVAGQITAENRIVDIKGELRILNGTLSIDSSALKGNLTLPETFTFRTDYIFSDITADSFSGSVQYDIQEVNVSPVKLDNLPDILTQEGTNISLADPMIYFEIDNPFFENSIQVVTGIDITAEHRTNGTLRFTTDEPQITLGHGTDYYISYLISPKKNPSVVDASFSNPIWIPFSSLGKILESPASMTPDGLPSVIDIDIRRPHVPITKVTDFELGDKGPFVGRYTFIAPLQFGENSAIRYTDALDGWWSEDMSDLHITNLSVAANVSTDVPVELQFSGYPIDRDGKRIEGVSISDVTIPANARDYQLIITVTGEVTDLDGLRFVARAKSTKDAAALSPDMNITITNIRPTVSGYFDKEF